MNTSWEQCPSVSNDINLVGDGSEMLGYVRHTNEVMCSKKYEVHVLEPDGFYEICGSYGTLEKAKEALILQIVTMRLS